MEKNFEPLKKFLDRFYLELTELHEANLNVSEKNGFCLYNYNQNVLVPRDDPIIRMCRGIVLDKDGEVMNQPFNRFFNFHEAECDKIDIANADIFEKLDGSLISVWHTGTEWEVTTRGVFYPHEDSHNFKETFCRLFDNFDRLWTDVTYMFELISRDNKIVTKYEEEKVVLIGARGRKTGAEVSQEDLDYVAINLEVPRPMRYKATSVDECRKLFEGMRDDEEGIVIVDDKFHRVKLKQESYLKMAKIISLKDQDVLDFILGKVELDADFTDMPELKEKMERVEEIHDEVMEYASKIYNNIEDIESDKEFALHALNYKIKGILFGLRKGRSLDYMDIRWKKLVELHDSIVKPVPKKLILLRGCPGSGKTSWVRENELQPYALDGDTLRLMFCSPNPHISQEYDNHVWGFLKRAVDERMKNGSFTIIDSVNCTEKYVNQYRKLCEENGFEFESKRFDIPLSVAIERNENREAYRRVPHDVIKKMHKKLQDDK